MIRVKATREGLVGKQTACGWTIDTVTPFVALPSERALHRQVRVSNPAAGKSIVATVLDVGPWNTHDDAYVFQPATNGVNPAIPSDFEGVTETRPASERGISLSGDGTNGAGIDLGQAVWSALEMRDNGLVDWEFLP